LYSAWSISRKKPAPDLIISAATRVFDALWVDTGFPKGNATDIESRALAGHDRCDFVVSVPGSAPEGASPYVYEALTVSFTIH
jgi:hypothetical protein